MIIVAVVYGVIALLLFSFPYFLHLRTHKLAIQDSHTGSEKEISAVSTDVKGRTDESQGLLDEHYGKPRVFQELVGIRTPEIF
jgi:hypothetical protein